MDGTLTYTGNTSIATNGVLVIGANGLWQDTQGNQSYVGSTINNGTFIYNSPNDQTNAGVISGYGQ